MAQDAAGRLLAYQDKNVYRSLDGISWTKRNGGPISAAGLLTAHPSRPDTLWLGDPGVLRSTDGGATWLPFGLSGKMITDVSVGGNGAALHAGVIWGGAWERSLVDPSGFYLLPPCRAVDTRLLGSPLVGATTRTFALGGACGVPADAKSVAVNLTVVNPGADGSLNVFPGDEVAPLASTVSFRGGRTRANNAVLPVSQDGNAALNVKTTLSAGAADFLIDVVGYYK
jgi:hypothetical protein